MVISGLEIGDQELRRRAMQTVLASWQAYARGARRASVVRGPGVAVAVFPEGPERDVYNNAVLDTGLQGEARARALDATEAAYASAGIQQFAVWAHEDEAPMRAALAARGYRVVESTRAMSAVLTAGPAGTGTASVARIGWDEYLAHLAAFGLPPALLAGIDARAFDVVGVRRGGEIVAAGLAIDHDGDCGIYNISTLPTARRHGLGTAVTSALLQGALERGCATASLQSTPMAERLYAHAGFRDLGRILEHAPSLPVTGAGRPRPRSAGR
jgi:ribosomal protein S18 acetylase RimI-like enzyme